MKTERIEELEQALTELVEAAASVVSDYDCGALEYSAVLELRDKIGECREVLDED